MGDATHRPSEVQSGAVSPTQRLDSWKDIANYLKRSVRTVQRWEQTRGLPVYRLPGGSRHAVCAVKAEVDAWWHTKRHEIESHEAVLLGRGSGRHGWLWAATGFAIAAVVGAAGYLSFSGTVRAEALAPVQLTSYPGSEFDPSFSPDGKRIAFAWNGEQQDNYDIYVQYAGAPGPFRLTREASVDCSPAWSPDGESIAFLRLSPRGRAAVMLTTPSGGTERKLAELYAPELPLERHTGPHLAWAKDGRWLVVSDKAAENEPFGLFRLSVETGDKKRLTRPGEETPEGDLGAALSPDGKTLAFARFVSASSSDLYTLGVGDDLLPRGRPRRETFDSRRTMNPTWTADGRRLLYSSGHGQQLRLWVKEPGRTGRPLGLNDARKMSRCPAIGPGQRRLVYECLRQEVNIWRAGLPTPGNGAGTPSRFIFSSMEDRHPQFSPDGSRIAFRSSRSGRPQVWVCDIRGANCRQITRLEGSVTAKPSWSPDGSRIAFAGRVSGQSDIYVVDVAGGVPRQITTNSANDSAPSWSADGNWIYFASDRSGQWQIWKKLLHGGAAMQVTRGGGHVPRESQDGAFVYYVKGDRVNSELWRLSAAEGEELVAPSVASGAYAMTREGIYFIPRERSEGPGADLQLLRFDTSLIESLFKMENEAGGITVSPDGRWLLWSQVDDDCHDLMLVEEFR